VRIESGPAIVVDEARCRDTANREWPLAQTEGAMPREDPLLTDARGARVNVGDCVRATRGRYAGATGTVLRRIDRHFFIEADGVIIAVPAADAVAERTEEIDVIGKEIAIIAQEGIAEGYTIVAMTTDGGVRAIGKEAVELRLADYGTRWKFVEKEHPRTESQ
jgi:hypothetical protein